MASTTRGHETRASSVALQFRQALGFSDNADIPCLANMPRAGSCNRACAERHRETITQFLVNMFNEISTNGSVITTKIVIDLRYQLAELLICSKSKHRELKSSQGSQLRHVDEILEMRIKAWHQAQQARETAASDTRAAKSAGKKEKQQARASSGRAGRRSDIGLPLAIMEKGEENGEGGSNQRQKDREKLKPAKSRQRRSLDSQPGGTTALNSTLLDPAKPALRKLVLVTPSQARRRSGGNTAHQRIVLTDDDEDNDDQEGEMEREHGPVTTGRTKPKHAQSGQRPQDDRRSITPKTKRVTPKSKSSTKQRGMVPGFSTYRDKSVYDLTADESQSPVETPPSAKANYDFSSPPYASSASSVYSDVGEGSPTRGCRSLAVRGQTKFARWIVHDTDSDLESGAEYVPSNGSTAWSSSDGDDDDDDGGEEEEKWVEEEEEEGGEEEEEAADDESDARSDTGIRDDFGSHNTGSQWALPAAREMSVKEGPMVFTPYNTKEKSVEKIIELIGRKERRSTAGYVYCFAAKGDLRRHLKIGYVAYKDDEKSREPALLLNEIPKQGPLKQRFSVHKRQCGYELDFQFAVYMPCAAHRMERLVHRTLHPQRHLAVCHHASCSTKHHKEWFRIAVEKALETVKEWERFSRLMPYDDKGNMTEHWKQAMEEWDGRTNEFKGMEGNAWLKGPWRDFVREGEVGEKELEEKLERKMENLKKKRIKLIGRLNQLEQKEIHMQLEALGEEEEAIRAEQRQSRLGRGR